MHPHKYWYEIAKDIRPVNTAPTEAAAKERFVEFTATSGAQYPAIITLWENARSEFVRFLDYDVEIRRVICSTDERCFRRHSPANHSDRRSQISRAFQQPVAWGPVLIMDDSAPCGRYMVPHSSARCSGDSNR